MNNQTVTCQHKNGCMIPMQDLEGNYVEPKYMICSDCRLVTKGETHDGSTSQ